MPVPSTDPDDAAGASGRSVFCMTPLWGIGDGSRSWRIAICGLAAGAVLAVGGCGGSSKPAYCTARSNLESSIQGVSNLSVSSGISGLQSQFEKIETAAATLVVEAKSDFPSQTGTIESSAAALDSAVKAVTSNPSAGSISGVITAASNMVTAIKNFLSATKSKCS